MVAAQLRHRFKPDYAPTEALSRPQESSHLSMRHGHQHLGSTRLLTDLVPKPERQIKATRDQQKDWTNGYNRDPLAVSLDHMLCAAVLFFDNNINTHNIDEAH